MSLRKSKYLRDESPSIAESVRRGLVPCVFQRSPSGSCCGLWRELRPRRGEV